MALKWKYSQFRPSTCFDHSGGRPSMGQTFLAVCFSAQPPMIMTIGAKSNIGSEYVGIATRVFSQTPEIKGNLRIRCDLFVTPGKHAYRPFELTSPVTRFTGSYLELAGLASLPAPLSHDKSSCFRQSFGLTASPRLRNGLLDLRKKNDIAHIIKQR
jgi:hypothetical protein